MWPLPFQAAVKVLTQLLHSPRAVAGGGAFESCLAMHLQHQAQLLRRPCTDRSSIEGSARRSAHSSVSGMSVSSSKSSSTDIGGVTGSSTSCFSWWDTVCGLNDTSMTADRLAEGARAPIFQGGAAKVEAAKVEVAKVAAAKVEAEGVSAGYGPALAEQRRQLAVVLDMFASCLQAVLPFLLYHCHYHCHCHC